MSARARREHRGVVLAICLAGYACLFLVVALAATLAARRSRAGASDRELRRRRPEPLHHEYRVQEADDSGSPVTWGEHVTDEQYNAAPAG